MLIRAAMPQRGDVLILGTAKSFEVYAVGRVVRDGQQDFPGEAGVTYSCVRVTAEAVAKAIVAPGHRIHFRDLDTGEWSEILT
jgi:type IV secretory pathway ATPase VirB11/archaellum biosynthesis ATPase